MYAIVEIAGQQFKVEKEQELFVHRLEGETGSTVEFDRVLLLDKDGKITVGTPVVNGMLVKAKILEHMKGDKVIVFHKKRRKGYQKLNGHRQYMSRILIEDILAGTKKQEKKAEAKKEQPKKVGTKKEQPKKEESKKEESKKEVKAGAKATPEKTVKGKVQVKPKAENKTATTKAKTSKPAAKKSVSEAAKKSKAEAKPKATKAEKPEKKEKSEPKAKENKEEKEN